MATAGFPRSSLLSRRRSCEEETAAVLRVAVEVTVLGSSDARAHPDVDLIFWTAAKKTHPGRFYLHNVRHAPRLFLLRTNS